MSQSFLDHENNNRAVAAHMRGSGSWDGVPWSGLGSRRNRGSEKSVRPPGFLDANRTAAGVSQAVDAAYHGVASEAEDIGFRAECETSGPPGPH